MVVAFLSYFVYIHTFKLIVFNGTDDFREAYDQTFSVLMFTLYHCSNYQCIPGLDAPCSIGDNGLL